MKCAWGSCENEGTVFVATLEIHDGDHIGKFSVYKGPMRKFPVYVCEDHVSMVRYVSGPLSGYSFNFEAVKGGGTRPRPS